MKRMKSDILCKKGKENHKKIRDVKIRDVRGRKMGGDNKLCNVDGKRGDYIKN